MTSINTGDEPIIRPSPLLLQVCTEATPHSPGSALCLKSTWKSRCLLLSKKNIRRNTSLKSNREDGDHCTDSKEDESFFVTFALLSHLAVHLRDRVPRGIHVKGSIPYLGGFTGKDIAVSVTN